MIPFDIEEAMKSGTYISGTTGTGKTDVAMYQAEQLMKEGIIVIVFDPSQDWMNRSSMQKVYTPKTLCANWNYESVIFDTSQMTITDQLTFVETFCKNLIETYANPDHPKKPTFLIFEEAHTYFPQGCMTAKAYRNTVRMMTQGRNFGVRFCCITQFASMIDKKAMRYMRQRYFGYTDEPNDTEYILRMFPKEFKEQGTKYLMGLKGGQFIYKCGNDVDQFEIAPFLSESKPEAAEVPQRAPIAPTADTRQYQNTGGNAIATARLAFVILFALALLWIMANMRK
jgi:hypothetical protein